MLTECGMNLSISFLFFLLEDSKGLEKPLLPEYSIIILNPNRYFIKIAIKTNNKQYIKSLYFKHAAQEVTDRERPQNCVPKGHRDQEPYLRKVAHRRVFRNVQPLLR